ncbi:hypothetical protein [Algisphaera agarilytica]|uniref:Uncharacterized protein n=1 Tax=Algisphaera agarilytica TaxID=1385975 RepID=A0A7X0H7I7_9BACT|nr:hypothetical protein [Algisphaera agarilytica]MBB6429561.1 hypothetical protein [Algisphaera agarilytica]
MSLLRPPSPGKETPAPGLPPLPEVTNREETVDLDAMHGRAESMSRKRGLLFLSALLLGVLWGVAAEHFEVRWSWPIVLVGVFFGYAWSRVGQGSAGWAVGLTAGLYLVSAVAGFTMSRHFPSERIIQQNPAVLQAAVHLWMQENNELPELRGVGRLGDEAVGDLGDEVVTAFDIEQLVIAEAEALSPGEQREVLSWYYDQAGGRAGVERGRGWGAGLAACLWLGAGCWIAWRLGNRKEEIELE